MTKQIAQILENGGADAIHVSGAIKNQIMNQPNYYHSEGALVHLAAGIKSVVNIPVISVGRIRNLKLADDIIREGKADLISMGGVLIADPFMPQKAISEKYDEINWCLSCNHCVQSVGEGHLQCAINPEVGYERECLDLDKEVSPKKIDIVGGGLSGLKAAQVAAQRGHHVTLYEKSDVLGGNMNTAAVPPYKGIFLEPINNLVCSLKKLPVTIKTNSEWSVSKIKETNPDVIIIATGASSVFPPIEGLDPAIHPNAIDVLNGKAKVGERVIILGGGSIGAELADYLSGAGKEVQLVEMLDDIAMDMPRQIQTTLKSRLAGKGVDILTSTKFKRCNNQEVFIENQDGIKSLGKFDSIIVSLGLASKNTYEMLSESSIEYHIIGDAKKARNVREALFEGLMTGIQL